MGEEQVIKPPKADIEPVEHRIHDDLRVDNYHWLREREAERVVDHLEAENRYALQMMAGTRDLQDQLYKEMRSRIQETDQSVPVKIDDFLYYRRLEKDRQYPIFCRRRGEEGEEEILLDVNAEAEGYDYTRLGNYRVSPDHRYLAYSLDTTGSEEYTLQIRDLESGETLSDRIEGTYYGLEWANDNRTLYYTTLDSTMRPYRLYRHRLGQGEDELILEELDESYFLWLSKSRSRRYVFASLGSKLTDEVHYLDADDPDAQLETVQPRIQGMEYSVEHHRDRAGQERFYITTNWEAENFRVMQVGVEAPERKNWEEVVPHDRHVKIDGVEPFLDHIVIQERENGLRHYRVIELKSGAEHRIEQPEPVYAISGSENPNFESTLFRFGYSSPVTPPSIYDYDMQSRESTLRKQDEVANYDPEAYRCERVWAQGKDGTAIPMSLVYPRALRKDGTNPAILYGYGSYGISIEPAFSSSRISFLQRGALFAIAHIRGGGEMGRRWKEEGRFLKKQNTFDDFVSCAEHLINEGYTAPEKLGAIGGSAGGLLMGAVANQRPDLFKAILAAVPFVDVINTMLDASIPLTVTEWEEWGNPNDSEYYHYMKSYSPYDNVKAQAYPAILATAGLNDPRVQYWEPAKWVAKLRTLKTDDNPLLLKTNMGAGHGGASGRYDYLKESAFEYAFLLDQLLPDQ